MKLKCVCQNFFILHFFLIRAGRNNNFACFCKIQRFRKYCICSGENFLKNLKSTQLFALHHVIFVVLSVFFQTEYFKSAEIVAKMPISYLILFYFLSIMKEKI